MIKLFLLWLNRIFKVKEELIKFEICIHDTHKGNTLKVKKYWSEITGFSASKFDKIYFKKHKINTNRRNRGDNYFGLLRVLVCKSSSLNRKIAGWIEGICEICGIV